MLINAEGTVESITLRGYVDRFDTGRIVAFDELTLRVSRLGETTTVPLHVVLDEPASHTIKWKPGTTIRFRIDDADLLAEGPVFSGSLRDVQVVEARPE